MQKETKFSKELEFIKSLQTEDELKDHRLQLMVERAEIESDLGNPDDQREDLDSWRARAKFSFRTKGILITEIDRRLAEFKHKKSNDSFLATFMKIAVDNLTIETFDDLYERTQREYERIHKEM